MRTGIVAEDDASDDENAGGRLVPADDTLERLLKQFLEAHAKRCTDPACPIRTPNTQLRLTSALVPECEGTGRSCYRNQYSVIGRIGEWTAHLAIPELRMLGGNGRREAPMDTGSARGEGEIKTATIGVCGNEPARAVYRVRPGQRRRDALPQLFFELDDQFLDAFFGREICVPRDLVAVWAHLRSVYVVPIQAFPRPNGTFVLPVRRSANPPIRAIQTIFRHDLPALGRLGLSGLSLIREMYRSDVQVRLALAYLDELGERLDPEHMAQYREHPHLLLADARSWQAEAEARAHVNPRVRLAVAVSLVRLADQELAARKTRETARMARAEADARRGKVAHLDRELAFALLSVVTAAADRPLSALEMRHQYGLRRDTYFPPRFGSEARTRGIPVALQGERGLTNFCGEGKRRHLTLGERRQLESHLPGCRHLIARNAEHPLVLRVMDRLRRDAKANAIAARALRSLEAK